jgi:hypothetical protein
MKRLVFALALVGIVSTSLVGSAHAVTRVSVQPIEGALGPDLRKQVARMLRGKGFRVVTSVDRVQGTGQYLTLARDHRLAAFVSADIEERRTRHIVTFLVWNGANGSVLARWSASAAPKRLPKTVAKGFWKHFKQALQDAAPPPRPQQLDEAPPMFVDAG